MSTQKARRYVVRGAKAAAGSLLAAAAVAAVTAFAPVPAGTPGAQSSVSAVAGAAVSVSQAARLQGVQQDLARAVTLGQVTPDQARRFQERLSRRILAD
ncbi:hypothetical protein [Psychromicrobium xiongbiense]|uniref:hypothetical protein n=1 Tax=Psychromicrobium xiongbiense TaxID=3051184 RepID=UPI002557435E|nr:hypothetical protein [Psychromicrobium sp. YIM S02556]